jgi:hypothetical protein
MTNRSNTLFERKGRFLPYALCLKELPLSIYLLISLAKKIFQNKIHHQISVLIVYLLVLSTCRTDLNFALIAVHISGRCMSRWQVQKPQWEEKRERPCCKGKGRETFFGFEGSQAVPPLPSGKYTFETVWSSRKWRNVYFIASRGKKLRRTFTVYDQNFNINIGKTALNWYFDVLLGGLH